MEEKTGHVMYQFDTLFKKKKNFSLRENLIGGFEELDIVEFINEYTLNLKEQNIILSKFRRFLRNFLQINTETKQSVINQFTMKILYVGAKEILNEFLSMENIDFKKSEPFFIEICAALMFSRMQEDKISSSSLSRILYSIIDTKILNVINLNKILSKIIEPENLSFFDLDKKEKIEDAEIVKKIIKDYYEEYKIPNNISIKNI